MKNRMKNICILAILTLFLLMIELIPVTCLFWQVTGIYCPTCGMTRAFHSILNFHLAEAFTYNILSIPLFIFIVFSVLVLVYEILMNKWSYIPNILKILSNKFIVAFIFILLFISFVNNNLFI